MRPPSPPPPRKEGRDGRSRLVGRLGSAERREGTFHPLKSPPMVELPPPEQRGLRAAEAAREEDEEAHEERAVVDGA